MIFANLRRSVALGFKQLRDRRVLVLQALLGTRQTHHQQASAEWRLPKDESGPPCRAGLLRVVVGE